jgi:hypothetical protein
MAESQPEVTACKHRRFQYGVWSLTQLRGLEVDGTKITDEGINKLQKSLPQVRRIR